MAILAGPEVAYPYTRDSDAYISYGLQWGARLKAEVALDGDSVGAFRLNLEALMRRVGAYSVSGESQGGAGLFTAMPSIEYNVWNDFWIGFAAEIPIFRPKDGREMAFNDIGLPGLFGNSFGVTFRITAL